MKYDFKWLTLLGINVCVLVGIALNYQMHPQVMQDIPQPMQQPAIQLDLSPIKTEVSALASLIKHMQHADEASFNALISDTKTELQSKLEAIHDTITSLEEKQHPIKILPASTLPFQVLSIDSLQNLSVATVAYDYKTTALEKGDTLVGWQVTHIDFATQTIHFAGDAGEVHVSMGEARA